MPLPERRADPAAAFDQAVQAHRAGRLDEAASVYRRIPRQHPLYADSRFLLAEIAGRSKRTDEAADLLRQAIQARPRFPDALAQLGHLERGRGRPEAAVTAYRRALDIAPHPAIQNSLGNALMQTGDFAGAQAAYEAALALDPRFLEALSNKGDALQALGRHADAVAAYRAVLASRPQQVTTHLNLGMALLKLGRFEEGWREFEWRWRDRQLSPYFRPFDQPQWDGAALPGGTILIHGEQGIGDTLMMARYIPLVAARCASVVLECQPGMAAALDWMPGIRPHLSAVLARGEPLPKFDRQVPMMSLPGLFGTDLGSIPGQEPYLVVPEAEKAAWAARLPPSPGLRVGLVWAGDPAFINDRFRSPRLAPMLPLLDIPGIQFVLLQKGAGRRDLEGMRLPANVVDADPWIGSLADTAGLLANLDLLVSSCTAPVHLAGAMGVPSWVLLPYDADWRWFLERPDSPWYPSVRLFRQTAPGDWTGSIARVSAALAERASAGHDRM